MKAKADGAITLAIESLKIFPRQHIYYPACSAEEDAILAADLKQFGQREPVHVLPPNNKAGYAPYTLLDGHRRAQLLAKLGHTKIQAIVRSDLLDADPVTVDTMFLRPNAMRRHLSKIALARVMYYLFEIEESRKPEYSEESIRDRLGKLIEMSGRNLSRYWRVLEAPLEVQRAVDEGRAKLVTASKVCGLSAESRTELVAALRAAAPAQAQKIIESYVGAPSGKHVDATSAFRAMIKALQRHLNDIGGRVAEVNPYAIGRSCDVLEQVSRTIDHLRKRAKKPATKKQQEANVTKVMEEFMSIRKGTPCPPAGGRTLHE